MTPGRQRNYANYRYLSFCALASASPADVQSVRDTFEQLHAAIGSRERAPALAILDLDIQLSIASEDRLLTEEWTRAVESYWARWGAKGVVLPDLLSVIGQRRGEMLELAKQWLAGETVCRLSTAILMWAAGTRLQYTVRCCC